MSRELDERGGHEVGVMDNQRPPLEYGQTVCVNSELEERKRRVAEIMSNKNSYRAAEPRKLTDEQIFSAIIGRETTVSHEELQYLHDSTESSDYDYWIEMALHDRAVSRCQMDPEGKTIEHPTTKVFRLGIESIEAGKPSTLFIALLREIASRADECKLDVLHEMFPGDFPPVDHVQLSTALKKERIVNEFRKECKAESGRMSFKELKAQFKRKQQLKGRVATGESIDRILKEFGLDYKAKPGPAKKR